MSEFTLFIKWTLRNPLNSLFYYFKKINSIIKKKLFKNNNPYKNQLLIKDVDKLDKISYQKINISKIIHLAGSKIKVKDNINWRRKFKDSEDEERLHRFSWGIDIASQNKIKKRELDWIENEILRWYDIFYIEIINNKTKSLKWEPYTVSERISNIYLFYKIIKKEIPNSLKQRINNEAIFLINNLEFFYQSINNHIINNSRALYFASQICNNKKFEKISINIFKSTINKLITKNGFLREGSSHYQFIFHRWIFEIFYFSQLQKNNYSEYLGKISNKLFNGTLFFTTKTPNVSFQLFGDISPDFTPKWIMDFPKVCYSKKINRTKYNSWNNLFDTINKNNKSKFFQPYKNLVKKNIKSPGWFKFKKFDHEMIFRLNDTEPKLFPGHFHNDLGHFIYLYKKKEIFIDTGRYNYYDSNDFYGGNHNSITINKLGITPIEKRLPIKYSQSFNKIKCIETKNKLKITINMSGFGRIKKNLKWIRDITFLKKKLILSDTIGGKLNNGYVDSFFYTSSQCKKNKKQILIYSDNLKGLMKSNVKKQNINKYKASIHQYGELKIINQIHYNNFLNPEHNLNTNIFTIDWNR
jgi:hypothetical protein